MKKFFYRVRKGDSVVSLSSRFNVPTRDLIDQNALVREIEEGDVLILCPNDNAVKVRPHESENALSKRLNKGEDELKKTNGFPYFFYGLVVKS